MSGIDDSPLGDFLSSDASDAWGGGVGVLDQWSVSTYGYAEGYRRAGQLLVEASLSEPAIEGDRLVFPALFLYRHALELKLKNCLARGFSYLGDSSVPDNTHDLMRLWNDLEDVGVRCGIRLGGPSAEKAKWVAQEFQKLDTPAGIAFRYALATDGSPGPMPTDGRKVDLPRVRGLVEGAIETLDAWDTAVDEKINTEADMRQEFESYTDE